MTTSSAISEQLRRQSVVPVESTIPPEMTIEQWRRRRSRHPTRYEPRLILTRAGTQLRNGESAVAA